jgi:hypothetical protein
MKEGTGPAASRGRRVTKTPLETDGSRLRCSATWKVENTREENSTCLVGNKVSLPLLYLPLCCICFTQASAMSLNKFREQVKENKAVDFMRSYVRPVIDRQSDIELREKMRDFMR